MSREERLSADDQEEILLAQAVFTAVLQRLEKAVDEAGGPPLAAVLVELRGTGGVDDVPPVEDFQLAEFVHRLDMDELIERVDYLRSRPGRKPSGSRRSFGIAEVTDACFQAVLCALADLLHESRWQARFAEPFDMFEALDEILEKGRG